jgi:hypothetical protein
MRSPHFCNVDLDIEFKDKEDLKVLKAEVRRKVVVLVGGPVSPGCFLLRLEIVPEYENPDDTICAFCSLLEGLSVKGKHAWRSAHKKEFDVGYDADRSQHASQFSLRTDTLNRLSNLGATLGVTFYYFPTDDFPLSRRNVPTKPVSLRQKRK